MREGEVYKIVEKNMALFPLPQAMLMTREEIMLRIIEQPDVMGPGDDRLDLMRLAIELDGKATAFNYLFKSQGSAVFAEAEVLEQLLVLHEGCQGLCKFLIDVYDAAPECLKAGTTKNDLIGTAAHLQAEWETLKKDFDERKKFVIPADRPSIFRNLISLTMLALLGEERLCFFMAESNDAFAIVRKHPKCAGFFRKNH